MIQCATCADAAVPARIVALLPDAMATVEAADARRQDVSVALVEATVGDVVLVHAGVAIGTMR
jgi:hydrogenase expression/formation protein HypC